MSKFNQSHGLLQEIGALAGLYRNVFWMVGQRARRGPNWEEDLTQESLRIQVPERHSEQPLHGSPQHR